MKMSYRKHPHSPPSTAEQHTNNTIFKYTKTKYNHYFPLNLKSSTFLLLIPLLTLFFYFHFQSKFIISAVDRQPSLITKCPHDILPFYVYNLPHEFNLGFLNDCRHLNVYTDMCPHVANFGMGQPFRSNTSWYYTHQFLAEMIFHARAENHPCRTLDPRFAKMFYVPFYGGLYASSKFGETNFTIRDQNGVSLVKLLEKSPHWKRTNGREHFLVLGRTAWDFMRSDGDEKDYGFNRLLRFPAVQNMSVLTVERNPWNGANQFGIPYTSYFHPFYNSELRTWIENLRLQNRPYIFSFIGGRRKNLEKAAIRDDLITQCGNSDHCKLIECGRESSICHKPMKVLKVMMQSTFCLQAAGDSFTRRSTFDSILAGCIPVFFSNHTAYTQYEWYLPNDRGSYSVFIDENEVRFKGKLIESELMKMSPEKVVEMRENVIRLIPKLTYVNPNSTDEWEEDAVSVALRALSRMLLENGVVR